MSTRALGDAPRERGAAEAVAQVINPLADGLAAHTDVKTAYALLGCPRGSHHRPGPRGSSGSRRRDGGPGSSWPTRSLTT
jgi:hypothetical protein